MSDLITTLPQLVAYLSKRYTSLPDLNLTENQFNAYPLRLSQYYADLIDWHDHRDPLRKIAVPSPEEEISQAYELSDPIGDHARETVPGLIHRYPDRGLLLLTTHCRIHCRFCFRREVVGKGRPFNLEGIHSYLSAHKEVHEIIFSGGDPFTFPPAFLQQMVTKFATIPHIQRVRFHTRIPAVDPAHLNDEFVEVLKTIPGQVIIVIHTDHPREITPQFKEAATKLQKAGCLILSQSVLLKGVNDATETLQVLFEKLIAAGVKPYYLHHPDKVLNTSHFRVSIERGLQLFKPLRGHLSSICLPTYVLDLPGGFGKIPVTWLEKQSEKIYKAITFEGREILYEDPGE